MKKNWTILLLFLKNYVNRSLNGRLVLLTSIFFIHTAFLSAQTPTDTTQVGAKSRFDNISNVNNRSTQNQQKSTTWFKSEVKPLVKKAEHFFDPGTPWKAVVFSAVLPGLGQAYNQQIWKVPIVWGLFGAGVYFCTVTQENFTVYRDALRNRVKGLPDQFPELGNAALVSERDKFKNIRDIAFIATAAIYILQLADAFVFAHLWSFDVSKDLTVDFRPLINYQPALQSPVTGLTFKVGF